MLVKMMSNLFFFLILFQIQVPATFGWFVSVGCKKQMLCLFLFSASTIEMELIPALYGSETIKDCSVVVFLSLPILLPHHGLMEVSNAEGSCTCIYIAFVHQSPLFIPVQLICN